MAAFALGLIGDRRAAPPLTNALADPSPIVKGSAAEALGLIGDQQNATAIGQMARELLSTGVPAEIQADEGNVRREGDRARNGPY